MLSAIVVESWTKIQSIYLLYCKCCSCSFFQFSFLFDDADLSKKKVSALNDGIWQQITCNCFRIFQSTKFTLWTRQVNLLFLCVLPFFFCFFFAFFWNFASFYFVFVFCFLFPRFPFIFNKLNFVVKYSVVPPQRWCLFIIQHYHHHHLYCCPQIYYHPNAKAHKLWQPQSHWSKKIVILMRKFY